MILVFIVSVLISVVALWGSSRGRIWTAITICALLVALLVAVAAHASPRWFVVLYHEDGRYGYNEVFSYPSEEECKLKAQYILPQLYEFNQYNDGKWNLTCVPGEGENV